MGYAYRLTHNRFDAEDIAQETFLRAFRTIGKYKPSAPFKSWLLRIATNIFLDYKKAARNRDVTTGEMSAFANNAPSPVDAANRKELIETLFSLVQTLSKEQQVVIMLRGVEGMDYAQIAEILDMKENTVRWHMHEARKELREKLSRRFDLEGLFS